MNETPQIARFADDLTAVVLGEGAVVATALARLHPRFIAHLVIEGDDLELVVDGDDVTVILYGSWDTTPVGPRAFLWHRVMAGSTVLSSGGLDDDPETAARHLLWLLSPEDAATLDPAVNDPW